MEALQEIVAELLVMLDDCKLEGAVGGIVSEARVVADAEADWGDTFPRAS